MDYIQVDLSARQPPGYVYRLWAADGTCLYVGQTKLEPSLRIHAHTRKRWWPEVTRADYFVTYGDLSQAEQEEIARQNPRYCTPETGTGADAHLGHGRVNGYMSGGCRCPACREAWRKYMAAYRERKRIREAQKDVELHELRKALKAQQPDSLAMDNGSNPDYVTMDLAEYIERKNRGLIDGFTE